MAVPRLPLPRLPFPPSPPTVWAVDATSVQLAWGGLDAGPIVVSSDAGPRVELEHAGGPGAVVIDGLPTATPLNISIRWRGGTAEFPVRTAAALPGEELGRIATISDLHLGSGHFGFFKQMRNLADPAFAMASARAAIDEAVAWGAQHLVIKGDAAHHGRTADFQAVGDLVDAFPGLPITLIPGNHDVDCADGVPLPDVVGRRQIPYERHVAQVDFEGIRLVAANTTIEGRGIGTLAGVADDVLDLAAESQLPIFLAIHQQLQEHDQIRYWPPGIRGREANGFLDRLGSATKRALVTSGHTHRNRARLAGTTLVTEVGSTHHWPGVWAGYTVHETGIRQTVRRISDPEVIRWHEYTKNAVLRAWQNYAAGPLEQRCLAHPWP